MLGRLDVLGKPAFAGTDAAPLVGKPLAVLIYLLAHHDAVTRDTLANIFWPSQTREKSLQSLRQSLFLIRKIDPDLVTQDADRLRINRTRIESDIFEFNDAVQLRDLQRAITLWRGDFAQDLSVASAPEWHRWVDATRDQLRNRFAALLSVASEEARAALHVGEAMKLAQRAIDVQPYEITHRTRLITFQLDAGDVGAADATLKETRREFDEAEYADILNQLELRLRAMTHDRLKNPYETLAEPELVGRSAELSMIARAWDAARRKQTRVIAITGPGGIGKSRLADEGAAAAQRDRAVAAIAKASPGDEVVPLATVSSLVARLLQLPGAAGISPASESILTAIAPRFSRVPVTAAPPLSVSVGDALIDLVSAIAYEQPLYLLIDDLQWADPESRNILKRLVRDVHNETILFVLCYRKDELQRDVAHVLDRLEHDTHAERVTLADLSEADVEELLAGTIHFDDTSHITAVAQTVYSATRGRPYLISELLQRLADEEHLQFDDGRWVLRQAHFHNAIASATSAVATVDRRMSELNPEEIGLATSLASLPTTSTLDQVRKDAHLDAGVFTRAVGSLVEKRLLKWHEDQLVFTQDTLREQLRIRGLAARRIRRRKRIAVMAGALALLVTATTAAYLSTRQPLYGGGSLIYAHGDSLVELHPPKRENGRWSVTKQPLPIPRSSHLKGVFRDVEGRRWLTADANPADSSPYPVVITENGRNIVVNKRYREDSGSGPISPDGEWITFTQDNPATAAYDLDLYKSRLGGNDKSLLRKGVWVQNAMNWSADGSRIFLVAQGGAHDTLVILTPHGRELLKQPVAKGKNWGWCNDHTVFQTYSGDVGVAQFNVTTQKFDSIARIRATSPPACSPDFSVVAMVGVVEGQRRLLILDRKTGNYRTVKADEQIPGTVTSVWWLPARTQGVPRSIRLRHNPGTMQWGDSTMLVPEFRYAGPAPTRYPPVEWTSSDSAVVSVDSTGKAFANSRGTATIVARTLDWIADSLQIRVEATGEDPAVFRETFERWDTTDFYIIGYPRPVQALADGMGVLSIPGDGNYNDGVTTKQSFSLPRGGVVEAEFRLPLTRLDRQYFGLWLARTEPTPGRDPLNHMGWSVFEDAAISYPMQGTYGGVGVNAGGISLQFPGTPLIRKDEWNHFAIQLQPDGYAYFYVNRQRIAKSPIRLDNPVGARWRISVMGSGLQTRLHVRNLVLWNGPRRW